MPTRFEYINDLIAQGAYTRVEAFMKEHNLPDEAIYAKMAHSIQEDIDEAKEGKLSSELIDNLTIQMKKYDDEAGPWGIEMNEDLDVEDDSLNS